MKKYFPTFHKIWHWKAVPWRPIVGPLSESARRSDAISLLQILALGTKHQVDLAGLVAAFSEDHHGAQRARLRDLAGQLEQGVSLPDALEQTPGLLWDESLLAIRFGRQMGAMNKAIEDELEQQLAIVNHPAAWHPKVWIYWIMLLIYFLFIGWFLAVKIQPTYESIVHDFDIPTPFAMELFQLLSTIFVNWIGLVMLLGVFLVWFVATGRMHRSFHRGWLSRALPGRSNRRSAEVFQNLGTAASVGRPVPGAISTLARYHFDARVRGELLFVRNEVEQGSDAWASLGRTDLMSESDSDLCDAAAGAGNLSWVLSLLSHQRLWKSFGWARTAGDLVHPFVLLLFGAICLLLACSVFAPLTQIVLHLAR